MAKYNIFIGEQSSTLYGLSQRRAQLRRERRAYDSAIKKISGYIDNLEGLNAFIVTTLKGIASDGEYADWQHRIIKLELELGADSIDYNSVIEEVYDTELQSIHDLILGFASNKVSTNLSISKYSTDIQKIINEVKQVCDSAGIPFNYSPIDHKSSRVKTIWAQVHDAVEAEYKNQDSYEDTDGDGSVSGEIADALMEKNADKVQKASEFADGSEYEFETTVNGKDADFVKDGAVDSQDLSYLDSKAAYMASEEYNALSDEEKQAFINKYDLTGDNTVDSADTDALNSIYMKKTDVDTNEGEIFEAIGQPVDYASNSKYMTFANDDEAVTLTLDTSYFSDITYSIDDGKTWSDTYDGTSNKVSVKANYTYNSLTNYNRIATNATSVYGDVMTMVKNSEPGEMTELTTEYICANLFRNCTTIKDASNLILPATTLAMYCYSNMFSGCTSLSTAPDLPATTLASYCYQSMFNGCSSLTAAPDLPATTLARYCYSYMFNGCSSLTATPELPATTLAMYCYSNMFQSCSGLTDAPTLPATTLASGCYMSMFYGCTSLTAAPALPATTLASGCYSSMFRGCTSLTAAPELPATTLDIDCYQSMFYGCTSLTAAPELLATTLASNCYASMFYYCSGLTAAPELPATTLASNCYFSMFRGCTGLTTAPDLPATTLVHDCYSNMFRGCTSLTAAPELPATALADYCYTMMFYGCSSLTAAPDLPATTLASNCYNSMFYGCTSLTYIKCLSTSDMSSAAYTNNWTYGVSSTGTFIKAASNTTWTTGTGGIPKGWTVQTA